MYYPGRNRAGRRTLKKCPFFTATTGSGITGAVNSSHHSRERSDPHPVYSLPRPSSAQHPSSSLFELVFSHGVGNASYEYPRAPACCVAACRPLTLSLALTTTAPPCTSAATAHVLLQAGTHEGRQAGTPEGRQAGRQECRHTGRQAGRWEGR